jgi:exportin-1
MFENAADDEQQYIQNLALFLTGFLGVHLKVQNDSPFSKDIVYGYGVFVRLSRVMFLTDKPTLF